MMGSPTGRAIRMPISPEVIGWLLVALVRLDSPATASTTGSTSLVCSGLTLRWR
jgi:hypothetical protein